MKKLSLVFLLCGVFCSSHSQTEIKLDDYFRTLKSVEVEIGNEKYDFLFDTGGGITMVSPDVIKKLGKTPYGHYTGFRMSGEKVESTLCDSLDIKIGGLRFYHPQVAIFDIMSLLPEGFKRVDGIISLKTFENHEITLDLSESKVIVETEESFRKKTRTMDPVPCRFASGPSGVELDLFIGIKAHDRLWWFLFDTGNIASAKISKHIAQEWGLEYQEGEITDIGEYTFDLAGHSITAPTILDDILYDGALSFDFIKQSVYAISFTQEKVWHKKKTW